MTERLADVGARIQGIRQLGAVVNAMRGIAAARAQQARNQLLAVASYTATIAAAIGRALALIPDSGAETAPRSTRPALVLFCAEQGFAGAFSERVLDSVGADLAAAEIFLIGTRGDAVTVRLVDEAVTERMLPESVLYYVLRAREIVVLDDAAAGKGVRGYMLYGDYRQPHPPSAIIDAVEDGDVDVAVVWGPMAGYFAAQGSKPLTIEPVQPSGDGMELPMAFYVSMEVRRGDNALLERLDDSLERNHAAISAILADYHVPILPDPFAPR